MKETLRWPLVIVASGLTVAALVIFDVDSPVRVVATLWFLLVCIGMAFVPLLGIRFRPPVLELALALVMSIVLDTLVATALTLAGLLSETSGFLVLAGLCLVGCALQMASDRSSTRLRPAPAPPS